MSEQEYTNNNYGGKNDSFESEDYIAEQLKSEDIDGSSVEILRKLAFLRLVDASKKYHTEKMQGKAPEVLEETKKTVSKTYSDYKRVKSWTETQ